MNEFILPDIGEGIVECELLEWLVKEGDMIEEDQPVAEVMTDKATVQIPAMHSGVVRKLHYAQGDIAKVHQPLFAMDIDGQQTVIESKEKADAVPQSSSDNQNMNIEAFILPDIGEGIVECEIVKWCIAEGDHVSEDQVVVEVMTDKAVVEIPAKHSGTITKFFHKQGDIAKVHTPLFEQTTQFESSTSSQLSNKKTVVTHSVTVTNNTNAHPSIRKNAESSLESNLQGGQFIPPIKMDGKVIASPAVRRVAKEQGINLNEVIGTGKKGRILKQDLKLHNQKSMIANDQTADHQLSKKETIDEVKIIKLRGVRAAMSKQMQLSVSSIPHFTVSDELEMDNLIKLRKALKPEFDEMGLKLSFMPFFIKALSLALSKFDELNAHFDDESQSLKVYRSHNIGMAVDSKIGLLVPNIKNVQNLSLIEITKEVARLIDCAREGKLSNSDLSNGTISISNIGVIGGTVATPIINKPEVAIVALGKAQRLPRFLESGEVVSKNIMTLNWSADHRVIDGATMVRFNNLWMSYLHSPERMLMELK